MSKNANETASAGKEKEPSKPAVEKSTEQNPSSNQSTAKEKLSSEAGQLLGQQKNIGKTGNKTELPELSLDDSGKQPRTKKDLETKTAAEVLAAGGPEAKVTAERLAHNASAEELQKNLPELVRLAAGGNKDSLIVLSAICSRQDTSAGLKEEALTGMRTLAGTSAGHDQVVSAILNEYRTHGDNGLLLASLGKICDTGAALPQAVRLAFAKGMSANPDSAEHASAAAGLFTVSEQWTANDRRLIENYFSKEILSQSHANADKIPAASQKALLESSINCLNSQGSSLEAQKLALGAISAFARQADQSTVGACQKAAESKELRPASTGALLNIYQRAENADARQASLSAAQSSSWGPPAENAVRDQMVNYATGKSNQLDSQASQYVYESRLRSQEPSDKSERSNADLQSEETLRQIQSRFVFLNTLPPAIRKELGAPEAALDPREVAAQIKNGTLKDGPYKVLLENLDEKFNELKKKQSDDFASKNKELDQLNKVKDMLTTELAGMTKDGVGFLDYINPFGNKPQEFKEHQAELVKKIRDYEQRIAEKTKEVQTANGQVQLLELMGKVNEHSKLILDGKTMEADRKAVEMWGQYGQDLRQLAPSVWQELVGQGPGAANAFERLKAAGQAFNGQMPTFEGAAAFDQGLTTLKQLTSDKADSDATRQQAIRALSGDPELQKLMEGAQTISKELPVLQQMIQSGMEGTKFEDFVKDARARGVNVEQALKDLEGHVPAIKERLEQMKKAQAEAADQKTKEELGKQIEGYEKALQLFDPNSATHQGLDNMLKMLKSPNFDESTFTNWLKREGVVIGVAIGCAVAAVATVASCGATSPILIAAVGAGAALIGSEATKEGLYHLNIGLGDGTRSRVGSYAAGEKVFDPTTGKYREQTLMGDVALPYAKQFAMDFAMCLATMGIGALASKGINSVISKVGAQRFSNLLARNAATIEQMSARSAQIEKELAHQGGESFRQRFMKEFMDECADELKESATEDALQRAMGKSNSVLGFLASCAVATGKGVRFNRSGGHVNVEAPDLSGFNQTVEQFRADGHKVEMHADGKATVTIGEDVFQLNYQQKAAQDIQAKPGDTGGTKTADASPAAGADRTSSQSRPATDSATKIEGPVRPEALAPSNDYANKHQITETIPDGFTTAGAGTDIDASGKFDAPRAAIVVDRANDPVLAGTINEARQHIAKLESERGALSPQEKMAALQEFVRGKFDLGTATGADAQAFNNAYVTFMTEHAGKRVPLGEMLSRDMGGCSEQALLLKVLADDLGVKGVSLVRGNGTGGGDSINHVWTTLDQGNAGPLVYDPRQNNVGRPYSDTPGHYKPGNEITGSQDAFDQTTAANDHNWRVVRETADGKFVVQHDGVRLVNRSQVSDLVNLNPQVQQEGLKVGQEYKVRNADGSVDGGWLVQGFTKSGDAILAKKNALEMTVAKADLHRLAPELQQRPDADRLSAERIAKKLPNLDIEALLANPNIRTSDIQALENLVNRRQRVDSLKHLDQTQRDNLAQQLDNRVQQMVFAGSQMDAAQVQRMQKSITDATLVYDRIQACDGTRQPKLDTGNVTAALDLLEMSWDTFDTDMKRRPISISYNSILAADAQPQAVSMYRDLLNSQRDIHGPGGDMGHFDNEPAIMADIEQRIQNGDSLSGFEYEWYMAQRVQGALTRTRLNGDNVVFVPSGHNSAADGAGIDGYLLNLSKGTVTPLDFAASPGALRGKAESNHAMWGIYIDKTDRSGAVASDNNVIGGLQSFLSGAQLQRTYTSLASAGATVNFSATNPGLNWDSTLSRAVPPSWNISDFGKPGTSSTSAPFLSFDSVTTDAMARAKNPNATTTGAEVESALTAYKNKINELAAANPGDPRLAALKYLHDRLANELPQRTYETRLGQHLQSALSDSAAVRATGTPDAIQSNPTLGIDPSSGQRCIDFELDLPISGQWPSGGNFGLRVTNVRVLENGQVIAAGTRYNGTTQSVELGHISKLGTAMPNLQQLALASPGSSFNLSSITIDGVTQNLDLNNPTHRAEFFKQNPALQHFAEARTDLKPADANTRESAAKILSKIPGLQVTPGLVVKVSREIKANENAITKLSVADTYLEVRAEELTGIKPGLDKAAATELNNRADAAVAAAAAKGIKLSKATALDNAIKEKYFLGLSDASYGLARSEVAAFMNQNPGATKADLIAHLKNYANVEFENSANEGFYNLLLELH